MHRWTQLLWGMMVVTLAGMLGCVYTKETKIVPAIVAGFKGQSRTDPSLLNHPPQTVAVLPFLNRTDQKEAFDIVRQSFHGHFSKLNYTVVPLYKVDYALRQAQLETPGKVAQASPQKLRDILQVDAVVRGEITHYDRIYAGIYSQVAVGAEVQMVDGKSGKELWWAKDVSRKHGGGIATTPVGLILTAAATALNMREIELLRSADDLFRTMVKTVPQPTLAQALRPPNITILVHDGMRRTDRYALRAGDVIKVAMEGDPRKKAFFKIGDFRKDILLREEEPGTYTGSYKVLPGDYVEEALITGTLADDQGNSTEWVDALGSVSIDTIPPAIPAGLKSIGRDRVVELSWEKGTDKDIAKYKVYRSPTPLTGYQEVGTTEFTVLLDQNLRNETSYYYKVSAIDLAGNESKVSDSIRATPVTPGPSPVKGILAGEITWFAGASPYQIEGEVVIDPKAVLIIEPGTVVRSPGEGILVLGKLMARGNQQSMITFESTAPDRAWKGIVFKGTKNDESSIEYAKISGAEVGINCISSSPLIAHNDISKNQTGIRVSEPFSRPTIRKNVISFNALLGVEVSSGADLELAENEIRGNQRDGILAREARLTLGQNRIFNNGESGIRLFSSGGVLQNNDLHDNGKYEIYNSAERDVLVDANNNWWGTREGAKVVDRIFGRVDFRRVLDAPFPQGKPIELPILKSPLSGPVGRDSFLILANSPYTLEKEVVLEEGATLFIQPGVTLKFNPATSILVRNGGIDARGTAERPITFTSNNAALSPGSYPVAARFEQPTKVASFFRYCIFEYAETGLEILYGAPEIDHCLIANQSQAGVKIDNDAQPQFSFSTFLKNLGTGGVVALQTSRPKFQRNNFLENPFAVQSFSSIYLDARENWWGSSPPKESLFIGEVNYGSWLEAPEKGAFGGGKP